MNEKLMAEDVLRPYGITLYYKGCEYLRDAIVLHWHRPDLKPGQLLQYVADRKGVKKSGVLSAISTISSVAWKVNGIACNQFLVVKQTWPNMLILSGGALANIAINYLLIPIL